MNNSVTTFWVKIYLAGDINVIKQACREFCLPGGLCITINQTLFIYAGGEEYGVEIGLINYPRFEDTQENILKKAYELAGKCRDASFQHSYLIMTPELTVWDSNRKHDGN